MIEIDGNALSENAAFKSFVSATIMTIGSTITGATIGISTRIDATTIMGDGTTIATITTVATTIIVGISQ